MSFRLINMSLAAVLGSIAGSLTFLIVAQIEAFQFSSVEELSLVLLLAIMVMMSTLLTSIIMYKRSYARDIKSGHWWRKLSHGFIQFPIRLAVAVAIMFLATSSTNLIAHFLVSVLDVSGILSAPLAGLITGLIVAALCYVIGELVHGITDTQLVILAVLVFVLAITEGIVNAETDRWWTEALSALGTDRGAFIAFDIAFVMGGLMVLSIMRDEMDAIRQLLTHAGRSQILALVIEILFIVGCLGLVGVGLFPWTGVTEQLHNNAAKAGFVSLTIAIVVLLITIPVFNTQFRMFSAIIVVFTVGSVMANSFGYINWTVMELTQIIAVGAWVAFFTHQTTALDAEFDLQRAQA